MANLLRSNVCSSSIRVMDDVDFAGWDLPPLDDADLPTEPPAERPPSSGVTFGSDLVGLRMARGEVLDLGDYVVNERAVVRPGLVGLADLAAADFGAMTQAERVDALLVVEQHRAWLDGVQQQLLSEVAGHDTSRESARLPQSSALPGTNRRIRRGLPRGIPARPGSDAGGRPR
jgi:hypothetical protein